MNTGTLFVLFTTTIEIFDVTLKSPSVATTEILYVPACVKSGVQLNAPVTGSITAPAGTGATNEYVTASPSGSTAKYPNANACPSATVVSFISCVNTGTLFVFVTVILTSILSVPPTGSVTLKFTT